MTTGSSCRRGSRRRNPHRTRRRSAACSRRISSTNVWRATANPQPKQSPGGVHCEACHGPGRAHLEAISQGKSQPSIINPAKLTNEAAIERCAQCHSGFAPVYDPVPDDLLISNQVNALKNTECYIQSGAGLSCMNCHDPHNDATNVEVKSAALCRSCHDRAAAKRASLCPVNQKDGCLGCHMPRVTKGSFTMVDHWIRVHPEQGVAANTHDDSLRTTVRPKREQLRMMVIEDQARATDSRRSPGSRRVVL